MNTLGRVLASASGLVQFLPLSVFAAYAFGQGAPTDDRWVVAFELAAVAAVVQLAILLVLAGTRDESFFADRYESTIGPRAGATFTVLDGVTHLGLVVSPRTAEAFAAWLERYGNIVAAGEEP